MDNSTLISQVAYVLEHEWSFGMAGMWYVALVMASKLDMGHWWAGENEWEGVLRQFTPYYDVMGLGEEDIKVKSWKSRLIAEDLVLGARGDKSRVEFIRNAAKWSNTGAIELPDGRYPIVYSRQDVEELRCRTGDVVVSLVINEAVVTGPEGAPDARYQLHLYEEGRSPWEGVLRDGPWQ